MANSIFDQTILNPRERPLTSDINQLQSQLYRTVREMYRQQFKRQNAANGTGFAQTGFIGDSFQVEADSPASLTVYVRSGIGFIEDSAGNATDINSITGLDDLCPYKPVALDSNQALTVPTPDPADPRIDIIEVKYDRRAENPLSRDIFTSSSPWNFVATLVNKTLAWILQGRVSTNGSAAINYKTGTPAAVPVAPSTTAGYIKIGEVYVPAAAASVAVLRDTRKILSPYGRAHCRLALSIPNTATAPTITTMSATPGVRAYVKNVLAGAFFVYILPGGTPANVVVSGVGNLTPTPLAICVDPASIGTLSGGEIAGLATNTAPAFANGFTGADRIILSCAFSAAIAAANTCYLDISWDYTS